MSRVWAIAGLTFREGVRMRIVLVFLLVLAFLLLMFPTALHGDGTVAGRLQNFLSYAIGATTFLLGLATVFLSCATLSNEIRLNQIHMVVTKPVARYQVLLGKWIGIMLLNLALLTACGTAIYAFARVIRNLPETNVRDRINVEDVVWTARVAAQPDRPVEEWKKAAEQHVIRMLQTGELQDDDFSKVNAFNERLKTEEIEWRSIKESEFRDYYFRNLTRPADSREAMQVRFRARGIPIPLEEILAIQWQFVDPETGALLGAPFLTEKRTAQRHQFLIRGQAIVSPKGEAVLRVTNPYDASERMNIQLEEKNALEILYKVGSFEANYVKALALSFMQLAYLAAAGLFFSTFVSFPVACLCTFTAFLIGLAYPFWLEAIGANIEIWDAEIDPYGRAGPFVRYLMVPIISMFPDFVKLSGGAKLVDGEYISWALLGEAALRMLAAGLIALFPFGWYIFHRREIAGVQV
jgi:hypothetical protein